MSHAAAPPPSARRWLARHRAAPMALVAAAVVGGLVAGCTSKSGTSAATSQPSSTASSVASSAGASPVASGTPGPSAPASYASVPPPDSAGPTAPPALSEPQQAAAWVAKVASAAKTVQLAVQSVRPDLSKFTSGSPDQATLAAAASLAHTAHDNLDAAKQVFVGAPSFIVGQAGQIADAADQLTMAMTALVAYTSTPTSDAFAKVQDLYQTGVSEWNEAVTIVWMDANLPPPTL